MLHTRISVQIIIEKFMHYILFLPIIISKFTHFCTHKKKMQHWFKLFFFLEKSKIHIFFKGLRRSPRILYDTDEKWFCVTNELFHFQTIFKIFQIFRILGYTNDSLKITGFTHGVFLWEYLTSEDSATYC